MESLWLDALNQVKDLTSNPEVFLDPSSCESHFNNSKVITKVLYDAAKLIESESTSNSNSKKDPDFMKTLPELIIDGFDSEQVWAGVQLQNKAKLEKFSKQIVDLTKYVADCDAPDQSLNENKTTSAIGMVALGRDALNLFTGETIENMDENSDISYDEDDLHELTMDSWSGKKSNAPEIETEMGDDESDANESIPTNGIASENESENNENPDDGDMDKILNDPDFQHMSDSDLDDLPFAHVESEDEEDYSDDENRQKIDADSERKKQEKEARDKKQQEVNTKTDQYLKNALNTLRSQSGKNTSDEIEVKPNISSRSEVEDQFFKLDEMEAFLDNQDALENRKIEREEKGLAEDQEEEDNLDLFGNDWNAENDEARTTTYKEYFTNEKSNTKLNKTTDSKEDTDDSGEDDMPMDIEAENSNVEMKRLLSEDETDEDLGEVKSTHELRQLRLKKKIQKMEHEAIGQVGGLGKEDTKMWQMKGEITATDRPENSLLQEHLDYDTVSKQAPVITEQVSKRLEDIIKQRIKDQAYDDVERKIKPVENPYEYKKKLILDQEKSKLSLAEVYEQEYLKQKTALEQSARKPGMLDDDGNEESPKEVAAIRKSMSILFSKLDSLTHFHFTPKARGNAEIKVIKNTATLSMEEVAPVAMSDANLLAPQEIIDKQRGEEIGSSERIDTDKKRDRRIKKSLQKKKQKENEKKEKAIDKLRPGLGNKYSKARVMKDLENAEKHGNGQLKRIKEDTMKGKTVKSSTAFFNQLQNDALNTVKQAKLQKHSEKSSKKISSSNLKL